jgi:biopolymer transport protein ExbD
MSRNRRELPEINAGSMADIAFLLLIFFLVTTTMDVDSGISRKLPPMPEENIETPEIHKRNIFVVLINKYNKVLAGIGSPTSMVEINGDGSISSSLKENIKIFVSNNGLNLNSSDSPEKAIVSLQNQEGTSYNMYIQVQNELTKAYNELRNEKSNIDYGKDFNKLDVEEQKIIKKFYPMKVSEAETKAN